MNRVIDIDTRESDRITLQDRLDSAKTQTERNRLGQFATPTALAQDILSYANALLPVDSPIHFLDPAFGTGSFYSALLRTFPRQRIVEAQGFEIDPLYGEPSVRLWADTGLNLTLADFTQEEANSHFNLLICNPPYVRHHHLANAEKIRLQLRTVGACGERISGLAGLYCHFICLSHSWLAPGAVSGWLVPSEFMDVNYGQAIKHYLLQSVTLLHIHRFDPADVQFADALVSSAVVWFVNASPPADHIVKFSFGGTLKEPRLLRAIPANELVHEKKWSRFPVASARVKADVPTISDFFKIKRGLATGDNSYFILSAEDINNRNLPWECFRPILPSSRFVKTDEIESDANGYPLLDRRYFLLDSRLSEAEIKKQYPQLWSYLEEGKARGVNKRYLCRHRAIWYAQEERPPAPIICTYLGRSDLKSGRPFRFILNHSQATVANTYLAMYPTPFLALELSRNPALIKLVWEYLNQIDPKQLLGEGRVYGGGLHKLEPKELGNVPVPEIAALLPNPSNSQIELSLETAI